MRPRRYDSNAQKQAAYRLRKKANRNFPVSGGDTVRTERSGALAGDAPKSGATLGDKKSTLEALRALMSETIEHPVADSKKPVVFRDDYGRVISEGQWEKWQEKKRRAKEKGFTYDDYSQ